MSEALEPPTHVSTEAPFVVRALTLAPRSTSHCTTSTRLRPHFDFCRILHIHVLCQTNNNTMMTESFIPSHFDKNHCNSPAKAPIV